MRHFVRLDRGETLRQLIKLLMGENATKPEAIAAESAKKLEVTPETKQIVDFVDTDTAVGLFEKFKDSSNVLMSDDSIAGASDSIKAINSLDTIEGFDAFVRSIVRASIAEGGSNDRADYDIYGLSSYESYRSLCYSDSEKKSRILGRMLIKDLALGARSMLALIITEYAASLSQKKQKLDDTRDEDFYNFWLTLNFKKRSLYIGLNTPRRRCIFSFTSGMFLPNYKESSSPREQRKQQLDFLRSLKHKEKKLVKKKTKVLRWKCNRYIPGTKLYMIRYVHRLLSCIDGASFVIIIRGAPRGIRRILKEVFWGRRGTHIKKKSTHITYVLFSSKFEHTMTQRAIKRRLRKNFQRRK